MQREDSLPGGHDGRVGRVAAVSKEASSPAAPSVVVSGAAWLDTSDTCSRHSLSVATPGPSGRPAASNSRWVQGSTGRWRRPGRVSRAAGGPRREAGPPAPLTAAAGAAYARAPRARGDGRRGKAGRAAQGRGHVPGRDQPQPVAIATGAFILAFIRDVTQARKLADLADLARAAAAARQAHHGQALLDSITTGSALRRGQPGHRRNAPAPGRHNPPDPRHRIHHLRPGNTYPAPRNDAG